MYYTVFAQRLLRCNSHFGQDRDFMLLAMNHRLVRNLSNPITLCCAMARQYRNVLTLWYVTTLCLGIT